MSLFNEPEKTQEEIAKEQVREINSNVERITGLSKTFSQKLYDLFWNNEKCTPQELIAIYGSDGYKLFQKLAIWNNAINAIDPSFVVPTVPEKWDYTINPDGTVTITEKVVEPNQNPEP